MPGGGNHALQQLITSAEIFVKEALSCHDASHDFQHIARVRRMAVRIAQDEGLEDADVQVDGQLGG